MRRSKSKYDKCKYKRCTYRRTHPLDKPRYCAKHVDKVLGVVGAATHFEYKEVPLKQRIKSFIWK